ncbi:MAG: hypothetical protein ACI4WX_13855 [Aristaeellaceae bacterium]
MNIDILGVEYEIEYKDMHDDDRDGYCDPTSKHIVIRSDNPNELEDVAWNQRKNLRHEIIHAFLWESGLGANFEHYHDFGHDETTVDWMAIQFPKLMKIFKEAGCMD